MTAQVNGSNRTEFTMIGRRESPKGNAAARRRLHRVWRRITINSANSFSSAACTVGINDTTSRRGQAPSSSDPFDRYQNTPVY